MTSEVIYSRKPHRITVMPNSSAGFFAEPVENGQDQYGAGSVDGKPGAVQRAAVDKFAVGHQMHSHFPQPAKQRHTQEDGNQRPDGVVAHIVQRLNQFSAFCLRDGVEPYGIGRPLHVIDHIVNAHVFCLTAFIETFLLAAQK